MTEDRTGVGEVAGTNNGGDSILRPELLNKIRPI